MVQPSSPAHMQCMSIPVLPVLAYNQKTCMYTCTFIGIRIVTFHIDGKISHNIDEAASWPCGVHLKEWTLPAGCAWQLLGDSDV